MNLNFPSALWHFVKLNRKPWKSRDLFSHAALSFSNNRHAAPFEIYSFHQPTIIIFSIGRPFNFPIKKRAETVEKSRSGVISPAFFHLVEIVYDWEDLLSSVPCIFWENLFLPFFLSLYLTYVSFRKVSKESDNADEGSIFAFKMKTHKYNFDPWFFSAFKRPLPFLISGVTLTQILSAKAASEKGRRGYYPRVYNFCDLPSYHVDKRKNVALKTTYYLPNKWI